MSCTMSCTSRAARKGMKRLSLVWFVCLICFCMSMGSGGKNARGPARDVINVVAWCTGKGTQTHTRTHTRARPKFAGRRSWMGIRARQHHTRNPHNKQTNKQHPCNAHVRLLALQTYSPSPHRVGCVAPRATGVKRALTCPPGLPCRRSRGSGCRARAA